MSDQPPMPAPPDDTRPMVGAPLPGLRTTLSDREIIDRLTRASRRGKLAGFHAGSPKGVVGGDVLGFWIEVFGQYFDRRLVVRASEPRQSDAEGAPRLLRFENRVKPLRIWVFWILIGLSAWPGVLLVHSMMATYFGWYPRAMWVSCAWYLPITLLPVPWMWSTAWKRSSAIADAEARQSIAKIAGHLGADVEQYG